MQNTPTVPGIPGGDTILGLSATIRRPTFGADPAAFVWGIFKENGERIIKEGEVLESEEESLKELKASYSTFQGKAIPLLKGMGIVH